MADSPEDSSDKVSEKKSNNGLLLIVVLLVCVGAGAVLLNLDSPQGTGTTETVASDTTASSNDPSVSIEETDKYRKVDVVGKLVDGFPELPRYPGSKIENSYEKSEADLVGYEAKFEVDDPVQKVTAYLRAEYLKLGWTIDPPEDSGSEIEEAFRVEKDGLVVHVEVEREGDETEIIVELPMRPKKTNT